MDNIFTEPSDILIWNLILSTLVFLLVYQILSLNKLQQSFKTRWRVWQSRKSRQKLDDMVPVSVTKSKNGNGNNESISVSGIYVYPVKSLRAVSLPSSKIDNLGLLHDRRFMIVRPTIISNNIQTSSYYHKLKIPTHRFFTQRQAPILATITASLPDETTGMLTLTHSNTKTKVSFQTSPEFICSQPDRYYAGIWDDVVEVADMGDEVAHFLQNVLESSTPPPTNAAAAAAAAPSTSNTSNNTTEASNTIESIPEVRLVALLPSSERYTDPQYIPSAGYSPITGTTPQVSLTDGFPILIASETSLDDLHHRMMMMMMINDSTEHPPTKTGKASGPNLPMSRFRPNIVLSGVPEAFEEDSWKNIIIGNLWFHLVKACPRCKQSCTDQITGERGEEPLKTLETFRKGSSNSCDVFFAMNAIVGEIVGESSRKGGCDDAGRVKFEKRISVGDKVRVITTGKPVWGQEAAPE